MGRFSVCPSIHLSVHSPLEGPEPARQALAPASQALDPASQASEPARQAWLAGSEAWLAASEPCLAGSEASPRGGDGCMDRQKISPFYWTSIGAAALLQPNFNPKTV